MHLSDRLERTILSRLINLLLHFSKSGSKSFSLRQQDIACVLGVSRVSVNKSLKYLQESGAISTKRSNIEILDYDTLERMVSLSNESPEDI